MSLTFVASVYGGTDATGTTLDTASSLNVATGDLLVAWCKHEGANGTFAVAKNDGSGDNAFTFDAGDEENHSNGDLNASHGYRLSATADATFTARFTSSSRPYRSVIIHQFRPDASETVTKDGSVEAQGSGTTMSSGNYTSSGADQAAVGGYGEYVGNNSAAHQINAVNAAAVVQVSATTVNFTAAWYRLPTAGFTGPAACTNTSSAAWICAGLSFASAAAGGIAIPVLTRQYRARWL